MSVDRNGNVKEKKVQQTIRYLRRKNLGNFEHEELEINDVVAEGAEIKNTIMGVKALVQECLYTDIPMDKKVVTPATLTRNGDVKIVTVVTKDKKDDKKVEDKKVTTSEKENPKKDEGTVSQEKPQETEVKLDASTTTAAATTETTTATTTSEAKVDVPATETPAPAADTKVEDKSAKTKEKKAQKETVIVTKKTNITLFNRELEPHKNIIGTWFDADFAGWRKPEPLKKMGAVTRALSGKAEFLDAEGNILESFKVSFKEELAKLG